MNTKDAKQKGISLLECILVIILIVIVVFVIKNARSGKYEELKIDETVKVEDNFELTVNSNRIGKRIHPLNAINEHTYYQSENGKKYVDIVVVVNNLDINEIKYEDFFSEVRMKVGKESYETIIIPESDDGTKFFDSKVLPAKTPVKYHIAAQIDESELSSNEDVEVLFDLKNDKYKYKYVLTLVNTTTITNDFKNDPKEPSINVVYTEENIEINKSESVKNSCSFRLLSSKFTQNVVPTNSSITYSYFYSGEGYVYLDLVMEVKNLRLHEVKQDELMGSINLIYNNESYLLSKITEKNNGQDLNRYTNNYTIKPQEKMTYHMICKVPEKIVNSKEHKYVEFYIDGETFIYNL